MNRRFEVHDGRSKKLRIRMWYVWDTVTYSVCGAWYYTREEAQAEADRLNTEER